MPALDLSADARADVGATQSKAEDVGGRLLAEDAVVAMFADRTAGVSKRVRDQLPKLENNLATQHLLIRGVAALDKQALMFRAERRWPRAFMRAGPGSVRLTCKVLLTWDDMTSLRSFDLSPRNTFQVKRITGFYPRVQVDASGF